MQPVSYALVAIIVLAGCTGPVAEKPADASPKDEVRRVRDRGSLTTFQACKAVPRRELHPVEACYIKELSRECTPVHDCFVSCLASPDGHKVGGGCHHLCLSPATGHSWQDRPADSVWEKCSHLEPANG